jgi:hypothetical protein
MAARAALMETSTVLQEQTRLGLCMQSMVGFSAGSTDEASATAHVTALIEQRRKHLTAPMAIARGVRDGS